MSEPFQCAECEALLQEIVDAITELRSSSKWPEISRHQEMVWGMLKGEDCFDDLPDTLRFRPTRPGEDTPEGDTRVRDALWKMMDHMKRTGHKWPGQT